MALSRVRALVTRYPLVGNAFALSGMYAAADLSQQTIAGQPEYDFSSPARMVIMAATVFAPIYSAWYPRLDRWLPGRSPRVVLIKILLDQGALGAFTGFLFFAGNSALEGKDRRTVLADTKERLPKAYITGWVYWPIVQAINFVFLPTAFRTVYVGAAAFVWTNFMCYLKSPSRQKATASETKEDKS